MQVNCYLVKTSERFFGFLEKWNVCWEWISKNVFSLASYLQVILNFLEIKVIQVQLMAPPVFFLKPLCVNSPQKSRK